MNDLVLQHDLFGNSIEIKELICFVIICLVFTAPAKWRVGLRAKIGHYRNSFFYYTVLINQQDQVHVDEKKITLVVLFHT